MRKQQAEAPPIGPRKHVRTRPVERSSPPETSTRTPKRSPTPVRPMSTEVRNAARKVILGRELPHGRLKVQATEMGYYGDARRRPGDVFVLQNAKREFSEKWMRPVPPETPERVTTGKDSLRRQHDETIAERYQPGLQTGRDDAPELPTGTADPLGALDHDGDPERE